VVFLLEIAALAQAATETRRKCEADLYDPTKPPVYLSFDRREESPDDAGRRVVWLRLKNNTRCALLVETPADPPPQRLRIARDEDGGLLKTPNGGIKLEENKDLRNGDTATIIYHVYSPGQKWANSNYAECVILTPPLRAGAEIIFRVDLNKFKKEQTLRTHFIFADENVASLHKLTGHSVEYAFRDLPLGIFATSK
jgi:hypothetical protein